MLRDSCKMVLLFNFLAPQDRHGTLKRDTQTSSIVKVCSGLYKERGPLLEAALLLSLAVQAL